MIISYLITVYIILNNNYTYIYIYLFIYNVGNIVIYNILLKFNQRQKIVEIFLHVVSVHFA